MTPEQAAIVAILYIVFILIGVGIAFVGGIAIRGLYRWTKKRVKEINDE